MNMKVILLGPPGAGKGTQADLIKERYRIPKITTGDMLREAVETGTEVGKEAKSYMDRGELVPDDVLINIISDRIKEEDCKPGFIMDGFPRTVPQAKALSELVGKDLEVILVDVSEDEIITRITGRRYCSNPKCGASYHIKYYPPKREGVCGVCGSQLYQREDDTEEVVKKRIEEYRAQTEPLIEYYADILHEVDGNVPKDEVFKEICRVLER